ncbi:MAG: 2-oxoacid:acceptor oxidoreductase subunit alpha [Candidatus Electrothrix sp. GW3-4]|uniref:2-oxoacid:acceptor oxidoreductase subunit alpha n=1 Tax=Candidatus Electrothrix sp. GW3-4 TaxID=3126740 RepID=UPI0030CF62D9
MNRKQLVNEVSIVFSGAAGQGIQSIEMILTKLLKREGYHVFSTKEFMSRIRGGINSTSLRVSSGRVNAPMEKADLFLPLIQDTTLHLQDKITEHTVIIGEQAVVQFDDMVGIPFSEIAKRCGNKIYSSSVAVGVIAGILDVGDSTIEKTFTKHFKGKDEKIIQENIQAAKEGIKESAKIQEHLEVDIEKDASVQDEMLISGTEAVAMGAVAANVRYVASYPMSPATGVLVKLAGWSEQTDCIIEQVEDEITAVNMALGAWYAGARAFVTTSGGGLALMSEGISLSGITEIPFVVHVAQRPGPGTGLPTRTEQGDLHLVLYSGHGDFPRIIYAPGTVEEAFYLTNRAFDLADKFQIPVFILTDQYFVDSLCNTPVWDLDKTVSEHHFTETAQDYKRYAITESGVSPRGIPGFGKGLVKVDSDEHDEEGLITENLNETRKAMVEKRFFRKSHSVRKEVLEPDCFGRKENELLVLSWGSIGNAVKHAFQLLESPPAGMHFSQVWPLPENIEDILSRYTRIAVVENNASAQFATLLKGYAGVPIAHNILKFTGLPFSQEEIAREIQSIQ